MSEHKVMAEVAGSIWKVDVAAGQQVQPGDTLCIVESMKMEIPVEAPVGGTVLRLLVSVGEAVTDEQVVCVLSTA